MAVLAKNGVWLVAFLTEVDFSIPKSLFYFLEKQMASLQPLSEQINKRQINDNTYICILAIYVQNQLSIGFSKKEIYS